MKAISIWQPWATLDRLVEWLRTSVYTNVAIGDGPLTVSFRKWRGDRKGQRCAVIARGRGPGPRNTLVEFEDGERVVGLRYCARSRR